MGLFERFLSVWVGLCILVGVSVGNTFPGIFSLISKLEYAHVNLVVALFIWVMIYPMMIQIDFTAIKDVGRRPKGLVLTLTINWLIKPFTMAALGWLFFRVFFSGWIDPQSAGEYFQVYSKIWGSLCQQTLICSKPWSGATASSHRRNRSRVPMSMPPGSPPP